MDLIDPNNVRLIPGESFHALFALRSGEPGEIGFFVRCLHPLDPRNGDLNVGQRAGLVKFDEVFLVVTMIRLNSTAEEVFDIWWDFHAPDGAAHFKRMADQENLTVHFYTPEGRRYSIDSANTFRKFFSYLDRLLGGTRPWTPVQFDRAVRGFCAQSYPKQNLWEMMQFTPESLPPEPVVPETVTAGDYPGIIPDELHPFYVYLGDKGHCVRIIPSMFEVEASDGNPDQFLYPAPVKTVLRCGIRWVKGFPVAPIPFIPGHGLAVPPDDTEFLLR